MPSYLNCRTANQVIASWLKAVEANGRGAVGAFLLRAPIWGGVSEALVSDGKYNFAIEYGSVQVATAGAMIAADLMRTAEIDPSAACANLGSFETAPPPRGVGFTDDRLWTLTPWYAAVGKADGVGFDQSDQLVFRRSWPGDGVIRRRTTGTGDAQCG